MKSDKPYGQDPLRLDMAALAADAARIEGRWPLAALSRLAEDEFGAIASAEVAWAAQGERRAVTGGDAEIWLHLQAQATVSRECQRCLQPVALPLSISTRLRFVHGEAAAAAFDAESEDDVLELVRWLDLRELVEDELLLALPVVPTHGQCPVPLVAPPDAPLAAEDAPHPFAALAGLKRGGKSN
jgi:uncharacterized protein